MRIAFVTPEFVTESYYSGGLANYVYRVSKALASLSHEVHVVTFSDIDQSDFDYAGIHVHRLKSCRIHKWIDRLTRNRLRGTSKWIDFTFKVYFKMKKLHKIAPFDIIQFPNSRACGLITSLFLRVPYVIRLSCYRPLLNRLDGIDRNLDAKATEWLEWLQLRTSQHIYAPSYTLKHILEQEANVTNVQVIRSPFYFETVERDTSVYQKHLKDKNYLLYFGRFQILKGFHLIARALPQVLQAHPDCYAAFVGLDTATHIAPSMKEYALSLCGKDSNRLIFIGQTPHSQLYPIINSARVIVLPSLIDNLPNTCLEAMALGKPVIGTRGASFDEIITDEENGFLVPVGDEKALADRINEAWIHPGLEEIGRAARRKVQDFSPDRTIKELLVYYKDILNGNV